MLLTTLENYILSKNCATKKRYKNKNAYFINNKIFALIEINDEDIYINLKNEPQYNRYLRIDNRNVHSSDYNHYHWNSILVENKKDFDFVFYMIDISYDLCICKMNKRERNIYQHETSE